LDKSKHPLPQHLVGGGFGVPSGAAATPLANLSDHLVGDRASRMTDVDLNDAQVLARAMIDPGHDPMMTAHATAIPSSALMRESPEPVLHGALDSHGLPTPGDEQGT
jgi:hypothetical protein